MVVPDGTEGQAGVAPGAVATETPKGNGVYSQEQVDKMLRDTRTAAMADVGRLKAEADKALKAANSAAERLRQMEKEREEAEIDAAKDAPDKLSAIREKQRRKAVESELEDARGKLDEANGRLSELTAKETEQARQKTAQEVAARLNVNPATLTKLAKATDGSVEAIEELAKDLPKVTPATPTNPNGRPAFRPDSNSTHGGAPAGKYEIMQKYTSGTINAIQYEKEMAAIGERP